MVKINQVILLALCYHSLSQFDVAQTFTEFIAHVFQDIVQCLYLIAHPNQVRFSLNVLQLDFLVTPFELGVAIFDQFVD